MNQPVRYIEYLLALRPGEHILLKLPEFLTEVDAARITRFVEAIALPPSK